MNDDSEAARKYRVTMLCAADKIDFRKNLVKMGSWNAFCLAESSD
jgi:hypothetical protein